MKCLSVCPSVCSSVRLSVVRKESLWNVRLYVRNVCPSVCPSVRPSVRLSVVCEEFIVLVMSARYVRIFHPLFVMSARVFASILRTRFDSNRLFRPQFYELVSIKMRFRWRNVGFSRFLVNPPGGYIWLYAGRCRAVPGGWTLCLYAGRCRECAHFGCV